jgi:hypothetical protein
MQGCAKFAELWTWYQVQLLTWGVVVYLECSREVVMAIWMLGPKSSMKFDHTETEEKNPWLRELGSPAAMGFVVRAETEQEARKLTANCATVEGKEAWLSSAFSECVRVIPDGPEMVIMSQVIY